MQGSKKHNGPNEYLGLIEQRANELLTEYEQQQTDEDADQAPHDTQGQDDSLREAAGGAGFQAMFQEEEKDGDDDDVMPVSAAMLGLGGGNGNGQ